MKRMGSPSRCLQPVRAPGASEQLDPACLGSQCSNEAKGEGEGSLPSREKYFEPGGANAIHAGSCKAGQILLPLRCS